MRSKIAAIACVSEPRLRQFRRARPQDAGIISDFVRTAYAKWVPLIGREPLPMQIDYDCGTRKDGTHQIWFDIEGLV